LLVNASGLVIPDRETAARLVPDSVHAVDPTTGSEFLAPWQRHRNGRWVVKRRGLPVRRHAQRRFQVLGATLLAEFLLPSQKDLGGLLKLPALSPKNALV